MLRTATAKLLWTCVLYIDHHTYTLLLLIHEVAKFFLFDMLAVAVSGSYNCLWENKEGGWLDLLPVSRLCFG